MDDFRWEVSRECLRKFLMELNGVQLLDAGCIWEEVVKDRDRQIEVAERVAFEREMRRVMRG